MKSVTILVLLVWGNAVWSAEPRTLEQLWRTEGLRTPESVLVYKTKKETVLFVSEIEGEGAAADGQGGIAKMSPSGEIIDRDWVRGLNAPKGLAYHKGILFIADLTELVEVNIETGQVLRKIAVPDAVFLNDVSVNSSGEVFISDTRTNKVHRIVDGKVDTYLENMTSANGLKVFSSNLVVAAGDTLWLVDKQKNQFKLVEGFAAQADGVEMTVPGEFLVSCWAGLIYYVHGDGRLELLLDSRKEEINTADIGYDHDEGIVYVPNFFKDSVTAYKLN